MPEVALCSFSIVPIQIAIMRKIPSKILDAENGAEAWL
jgi:hypothetical protein